MYEWLKDYQNLYEEIALLENNLERSKRELKRWTSGDLSGVKLTAESDGAKLEDHIERIEYELAHKTNDLYDLKKLINTFKGLDNKIIKMKWIEGMTLEQIAIELGYSYNYIKRKHAEAMRIIKFLDTIKEVTF